MRKFAILLLLMTTVSLSAQKTTEQIAKKITAEMTKVMSLSEKQSAQVHAIHVDKINQSKKLRADTKGNKEAFKKGKWKIDAESKKKLTKIVGKDKFTKWREHYKAKVAKKKKKK